jgi:hypothetical protein
MTHGLAVAQIYTTIYLFSEGVNVVLADANGGLLELRQTLTDIGNTISVIGERPRPDPDSASQCQTMPDRCQTQTFQKQQVGCF